MGELQPAEPRPIRVGERVAFLSGALVRFVQVALTARERALAKAKALARERGEPQLVLLSTPPSITPAPLVPGPLLVATCRSGDNEQHRAIDACYVLSNGAVLDILPADNRTSYTADFPDNVGERDEMLLRNLQLLHLLDPHPQGDLQARLWPSPRRSPLQPGRGTQTRPVPRQWLATPIGVVGSPYSTIFEVADPVQRNDVINQLYDRLSNEMSEWIGGGAPPITTWATYGKWASREAGDQIYQAGLALGALDDLAAAAASMRNWDRIGDAIGRLRLLRRRVDERDDTGTMISASLSLLALELGVDLAAVGDLSLIEAARLAPRLTTIVPPLQARMTRMRQVLADGNRDIMANAGVSYDAFLIAERAGQDGVARLRQLGFSDREQPEILAAFQRYKAARQASGEDRRRLVQEGNMLMVEYEQAIIAQPYYNRVYAEVNAVTSTVVLRVPGPGGTLRAIRVHRTVTGSDGAAVPDTGSAHWADYFQRIRTIAAVFEQGYDDPSLHRGVPLVQDFL